MDNEVEFQPLPIDSPPAVDPYQKLQADQPDVFEAVQGLAWLGYLETDFEWCGHDFQMRTLRGDEELAAALVHKEFRETLGDAKAWVWAQLALAVVSIDGDPNYCPPLGPDKRDLARARFKWMSSRWHWVVAEYLWAKYAELLGEQQRAIEAVQDLSNRSLSPFTPSPDSLTDPGTSAEEAPEDPPT